MLENFNPLMYGSARDVLVGLLRSLPDEDATGFARAAQMAGRAPRLAWETRPSLTAACEVAEMLAVQMGAPVAVAGLLPYLTDRWDGRGPLRRAKREGIPLPMRMRILHVVTDAAFDPAVVDCLVNDADEILAHLGGDDGRSRGICPPLDLTYARVRMRRLAAVTIAGQALRYSVRPRPAETVSTSTLHASPSSSR